MTIEQWLVLLLMPPAIPVVGYLLYALVVCRLPY